MSRNALMLNRMLGGYNALTRRRVTDDPTATALFAGEGAETADHAALARAKELEARGAPRDQVWSETGWWRGDADKKWRFEIDDRNAMLSPRANAIYAPNARAWPEDKGTAKPPPGQEFHPGVQLGELMTHDNLRAAYPGAFSDAEDESGTTLRMHFWKSKDPHGAAFTKPSNLQVPAKEWEPDTYNDYQYIEMGAPNRMLARSIGLHELQHYIQNREGFAAGTDPTIAGRDGYLNNPGEVEARTVQGRADMTPSQRAANPPWLSKPQRHPRHEK